MTALQQNSPTLRHIGFVQLRVSLGEPDNNLSSLRRLLAQLDPPRHSLIVLPELWATGFAYRKLPNVQEKVTALSGQLQELAARYDILLAGSLPERIPEKGNAFFNTLEIIGGTGTFGKYRKTHVFPGEEQAFCPGTSVSAPIGTPFGTFGCLICYDLRFPALARRQCQQGADLLLCSAEWPSVRIPHWRALAIARAIENQTFLIACNGVGTSDVLTLGGHSLIVTPAGEIVHEAGEEEEAKVVELNWQLKRDARVGFQSFTAEPYRLSAEKIATPACCAAEAERRSRAGQRVVYVPLEQEAEFPRAVELLEAARAGGDYLVAGFHLPKGQDGQQSSDMLKCFAALGCVDAVFDLGEISPSVEQRLRNFHHRSA